MRATPEPVPVALRPAAACLALLLGAATAAGAAQPDRLLDGVRTPRLAPHRAVTVSGIDVPLGPGRLAIEAATVVPAVSPAGRTIELVLIGAARLRLAPPDDVEAGQLRLFTG